MEAELKRARHDLRGRLNALKLCVSALEILQKPAEVIEFLDMIEEAADKTSQAMDVMEETLDRAAAASPAK